MKRHTFKIKYNSLNELQALCLIAATGAMATGTWAYVALQPLAQVIAYKIADHKMKQSFDAFHKIKGKIDILPVEVLAAIHISDALPEYEKTIYTTKIMPLHSLLKL